MTVLEQFVRRTAKRITRNGASVLITDGDPLLTAAFAELGWSDPHDESTPAAPLPATMEEVAVEVRAPEQAVVPHPQDR